MTKDFWYDFDSKYKTKINTNISNINQNIKQEIQKHSKNILARLQKNIVILLLHTEK